MDHKFSHLLFFCVQCTCTCYPAWICSAGVTTCTLPMYMYVYTLTTRWVVSPLAHPTCTCTCTYKCISNATHVVFPPTDSYTHMCAHHAHLHTHTHTLWVGNKSQLPHRAKPVRSHILLCTFQFIHLTANSIINFFRDLIWACMHVEWGVFMCI